ncbi:MAG: response regulator [Mariniphaga sp.]|nr:response regulator [Mariniphaga sp.]
MIKVLLIEDEVDIRESIRDFLNFEKFDVYTAPNGQLGIKKAEEVVPDIILCDILMPDLNGFEVLKQ